MVFTKVTMLIREDKLKGADARAALAQVGKPGHQGRAAKAIAKYLSTEDGDRILALERVTLPD